MIDAIILICMIRRSRPWMTSVPFEEGWWDAEQATTDQSTPQGSPAVPQFWEGPIVAQFLSISGSSGGTALFAEDYCYCCAVQDYSGP
mmetsp:Transcript_86307/g.129355  ORF Transcript_86307/g.129355 Transcript_86307/m.129355 type:complete len:88 (+) Transcript_86307:763-1026(+)